MTKVPVVAPEKSRKPRGSVIYRYRSAVTGKFVTRAYAGRFPHLTIRQRLTLSSRVLPQSLIGNRRFG